MCIEIFSVAVNVVVHSLLTVASPPTPRRSPISKVTESNNEVHVRRKLLSFFHKERNGGDKQRCPTFHANYSRTKIQNCEILQHGYMLHVFTVV